MAQRALPPGAIRRRAVFGLLDASGWTWATLQAIFWFLLIIFMLGYIPNLAYFFTVSQTVQVGYNFASIVNWCPAGNQGLPCPAPAGAVLPWQSSPDELALPEARSGSVIYQSGTTLYLIGGETDEGSTAEVLITNATSTDGDLDGNLTEWSEGPALPEPRADAAIGVYTGIPYVVGGVNAAGEPTDTVFKGIVEEGVLTGWELANGENGTDPLTLPQPITDAAIATGTSGFALIGGRDAEGQPVDDVHVAWIDEVSASGRLLAWEPLSGLNLPAPRANPVVGVVGDFIYVIGGEDEEGPTDSVFRLEVTDREPATGPAGDPLGWAVAQDDTLPEPRSDAVGFVAAGSIYVLGGDGEDGAPTQSTYWIVPDATTGDLPGGWQSLDQTDLPMPIAAAPISGIGSTAFIIGGRSDEGLTDDLMRAGLSPEAPFFQLGLFGATLPALAIEGEVGQQLGYINAMGVGMTNFVFLVLIGLAFSHRAATMRIFSRLSGGRLKVPPEQEYGP